MYDESRDQLIVGVVLLVTIAVIYLLTRKSEEFLVCPGNCPLTERFATTRSSDPYNEMDPEHIILQEHVRPSGEQHESTAELLHRAVNAKEGMHVEGMKTPSDDFERNAMLRQLDHQASIYASKSDNWQIDDLASNNM